MNDSNIDKQVADLIDALQSNETHAIPVEKLPENDFFFSLSEENHEQVIGHKVGHWQVDKVLGIGGMSVVYQVSRLDDQIKQQGALKVIAERFVYSSFKDRFLKERQILTDLNHPNIVKLLDAGITKTGIPWYVMEFIEGHDINTYVSNNKLNKKQIIDLIIPVCDALTCAHQFDVIHRDVKPSNVIISKDGQVKLFDFGIAHVTDDQQLNLTKTGMVIGTPGYMSPEQAKGLTQNINQSTDIFAVGVLLCELLTGEKPFKGEDITEISYATIHDEPFISKNLNNKDLIAIIFKCLQKDPVERYAEVEALKQDLLAFKRDQVVSARRITWRYRLKKLIQRHPKSSVVISVLIGGILISVAYGIFQFYQNQKQLIFTEQIVNQANQISAQVKLAHLLPLHNVQPTYKKIAAQAKLIEAQLTEQKDLAGGSAYSALGMAYLAMRKLDNAKSMLQQAEKLGHESSTLSRGMGIILSSEWRRIMGKKPSQEKIDQHKIEIYQPMMAYLKAAEIDHDYHYFVSGNVAYLEQQYDQAIELFNSAFKQNNGFYDALRMKSEAQLKKFQGEIRKSGHAQALSLLQASNTTLEKAINIGRSDPFNYISLCSNKAAEIQILGFTKQLEGLAGNIEKAAQVCANALELDPSAKSPWANRSFILLTSLGLLTTDEEKAALYEEVLNWTDSAVAMHPKDERLLLSQTRPLMGLADIAISNQQNPLPYFETALEKLEQVKALDDASSERRMFNETGRVHFSRANYHASQGEHEMAIEFYNQTIEAYLSSINIESDNVNLLNLGVVKYKAYENYRKLNLHDLAIDILSQSISSRLPILSENLKSFYVSFLDIFNSQLTLIEYKIEQNRPVVDNITDFQKYLVTACNYADKTEEQYKAIIKLSEQFNALSLSTTIDPCLNQP